MSMTQTSVTDISGQNGTHVDPEVIQVATRVEQYVMVREALKKLDAEHDEKRKPFVEAQTLLSGWLQQHLEKYGSESVRTAAGTVYLSTRYSASLADPEAFMKHVIETGQFELLDRRANVTAVKDYVQEKGGLPPGVNLSGIKTVGVRRAS